MPDFEQRQRYVNEHFKDSFEEIKHLYSVSDSDITQISPDSDHPLAAMVNEVVHQMDTYPPKNIFIIDKPDVNAFAIQNRNGDYRDIVVYTGLLNTLNPIETKGVLAHEIRHMDQTRFMHVIEAADYVNSANLRLQSMATKDDPFIKQAMVNGMGWVLDAVAKPYKSLHQRMELDADKAAASVVGNEHYISALEKIIFATEFPSEEYSKASLDEAMEANKKDVEEDQRLPARSGINVHELPMSDRIHVLRGEFDKISTRTREIVNRMDKVSAYGLGALACADSAITPNFSSVMACGMGVAGSVEDISAMLAQNADLPQSLVIDKLGRKAGKVIPVVGMPLGGYVAYEEISGEWENYVKEVTDLGDFIATVGVNTADVVTGFVPIPGGFMVSEGLRESLIASGFQVPDGIISALAKASEYQTPMASDEIKALRTQLSNDELFQHLKDERSPVYQRVVARLQKEALEKGMADDTVPLYVDRGINDYLLKASTGTYTPSGEALPTPEEWANSKMNENEIQAGDYVKNARNYATLAELKMDMEVDGPLTRRLKAMGKSSEEMMALTQPETGQSANLNAITSSVPKATNEEMLTYVKEIHQKLTETYGQPEEMADIKPLKEMVSDTRDVKEPTINTEIAMLPKSSEGVVSK